MICNAPTLKSISWWMIFLEESDGFLNVSGWNIKKYVKLRLSSKFCSINKQATPKGLLIFFIETEGDSVVSKACWLVPLIRIIDLFLLLSQSQEIHVQLKDADCTKGMCSDGCSAPPQSVGLLSTRTSLPDPHLHTMSGPGWASSTVGRPG